MEQYSISFDEFIGILFNHKKVEISHKTEKIIIDSYNFLKDFSKNKVIYGVNTGFGPMAQYRIEEKDQIVILLEWEHIFLPR